MSSRTLACVLVAVMGWGLLARAGLAQSPTARLATYQKDGQTFFALSLLSQEKPEASQKSDVVLLVDTSASQAGRIRNEQLAALEAILAGLTPSDRVALMAVDGRAVLLSEGWTAPSGAGIEAALRKLRARVPLGATDLEAGLRAAAGQFASGVSETEGPRARTVIYLGDGMSKLNMLTGPALEHVVTDLRAQRISVSSYVLGIEKNLHLLSVLANHTGGVVAVLSDGVDAAAAGRALAASTKAGVIWPEAVEFSEQVSRVFPQPMPPLRTDRDSIVIGTLSGSGPVRVSLQGSLLGRTVKQSWEVVPEKPSDDFAFLPKLVEAAALDKGLTLPTVGSAGLREAAYAVLFGVQQMVQQAQEALARGDFEGAKRVAEAALARDPDNPEAKTIQETARKALATGKLPPPSDSDLRLVGGAGGPPADAAAGLALELASEPPGLTLRVEEERKVVASKARAEVEQTLAEARRMMSDRPDQAEQVLKLRLDQVERMPELEPELRAQLRQQIELALRQVRQAKVVQDQRQEEALERAARAQEQERLNDALVLREQRITQIVERFASLMKEQRYEVADEEITPEIQKIARGTSIDSSLIYGGRFERATHESEQLWRRRHDQFVRAMHEVEVALVPFPDEPPIVYPPAQQWQQLTLDRQKYKAVDLGRRGGAEERIFKALQDPTTVEVAEMPLKDVISYLQESHNIPIVLMTKKLEEAGIQPDVPVTKTLRGITLRSALRLILKELELTYVVRDEVLQITTPEDAEGQLITKVYPVGDLVVPPANFMAMMGGMGGMNGMMGGMMNGGMMGGGMGMGMGGMGMGMGGMGMGGMGMGGMGGMGGMFAVEDDLRLGTSKPSDAPPVANAQRPSAPQPAASAASSKPATPAQRITLKPAAGQSLEEAWDAYFAAQESQLAALEDPAPARKQLLANIRQTVRELMDEKRYDEIAALIPAALRSGQMETWMYEALALALRAKALTKPLDGQEQELLERALLSAVDFAQDPNQAILIAAYMAQAGLYRRALDVYREVAKVDPTRPEPYIQGLALAQQLNDLEAIQWGCLGILSQAWPADQQHIPERAFRIARAAYEQLLSEGRTQEAQALDAAVRRAQVRDCVVVVTWTGEADVDLMVEEPAGTVVSQWQPRSVSGGVHLGDATKLLPSAPPGSQSEVYVCPEGFSGQYRLLVKNVWGRPTSGKVTVDVYTHYGTDRQTHIREQIPLEDKNAVVLFELNNGRRTDPLPEAQLARVRIENAANRALLAQQLAAANPQAAQNFANSLANSNPFFPFPVFPGFFFPGAVGYRPVITPLTSGADMTIPGNTVISADRRYVRTGPSPFFTQVTEVNTFNFVSGQGNTQQPGQGGVGGGGGFGGGGFF